MLNLKLTLCIVFCTVFASAAAGQSAELVPDKPYYRIGDTVRIEYRLPGVEEWASPILIAEGRRDKELARVVLKPPREGVIELSELTAHDGPVRLFIENTDLKDPTSKWIWVFSDLDPWPNALSIVGGNRVPMWEEFTVVITPPDGVDEMPPNMRLELWRPAFVIEGGAVVAENRFGLAFELNSTLSAPSMPGTYEFQLIDETTGAVLACLPLEVMLPSAESVIVELDLRFYNPYVPFKPPDGVVFTDTEFELRVGGFVFYNATIQDIETKRVLVSSNGGDVILAPPHPGPYELVVTGEIGDEPVIIRQPLWFAKHPDRGGGGGVLSLGNGPLEVGERASVKVASVEELGGDVPLWAAEVMEEHGALALRLVRDLDPDVNTPESLDTIAVFDPVELGQTVNINVAEPGSYWFELGAVGHDGWVSLQLVSADFKCMYPAGSGSIRLDKENYQPGASVQATLEAGWPVPDSLLNNDGDCWVTILTPSGHRTECIVKGGRVTGRLPLEGGVFQMRWYDKGRLIGTTPIRVPIELKPDHLRLVGAREIVYGEPIKVEVELDDRPLFSSKDTEVMVDLMARGEMSLTGTWKPPTGVASQVVEESGTFEFEAPFPGCYEIRLIVTGSEWSPMSSTYILARIPLEVQGPGGVVPVPGTPDAPEPTDLPFNAGELGSAIANDIRMAEVHCAKFSPLPIGTGSDHPDVVTELARENTEDVAPEYPRYIVQRAPTVPEVEIWGTGIPGPETNDWSHLIPKAVIDEHKLDGQWIVMAVYGQYLFALEGRSPELTWAGGDKHLDYKLLHAGTYSIEKVNGFDDPQWQDFWRGLSWRVSEPRIDHADVYIVAVRLAPNTWAGPYSFKLGDLAIDWTLPHATNMAETRFVRWLSAGGVKLGNGEWYERIHAVFKRDRFYVEIETSGDVLTDNRIPFELFVSRSGGPLDVVTYGKNLSTYEAYRVGNNRRLFRSRPIFVNDSQGLTAWRKRDGKRREALVALGAGDRLVARVVPHGVARQAALGMLHVYSTPAEVGASWREAVRQAARLMGVVPPRALEQLSREEFNTLLREPWDTVDSTPFVKVGGKEIKLRLGELAAMLLIRQRFNETMDRVLPDLTRLYHEVHNLRGGPALVRDILRGDVLHAGSPIGDIAVSDPRFPVGTVPFRLVYDDAWLDLTFKSDLAHRRAERKRWLDDVTKAAVDEYYVAAVKAYRYSKGREIKNWVPDTSLDLKNAKDMLKLTAIGMGRLVDQIKPNLLRLVEDPDAPRWDAFHWEVDTVARGYVGTIGALGEEFHTNEALIDQYNAMTMLVAAGTGFLLPEAAVARAIWAVINAVPMAITLTRELPDYLSRREDVQFALGAYQAIGQERYITADLRRKPGWAIALELAGGSLDVIASVAQLRHARSAWIALQSDTVVSEVLALEPRSFAVLSREHQMSALTRLAQVSEMRTAGETLTKLETTILNRGTQMLDEMQTFGDVLPARYLYPEMVGEATTFVMRDGRMEFVVSREYFELPHTLSFEDLSKGIDSGTATELEKFIPVRHETVTPRFVDVEQSTLTTALDTDFELPTGLRWGSFDVGGDVGEGTICRVYGIRRADPDAVKEVLKVTRNLEKSEENLARMVHCSNMLKGKVPQLPIKRSGMLGDVGWMVQDHIPDGAVLLESVAGKIDGDTISPLLRKQHRSRRIVGVRKADGTVGPMTKKQAHAICRTYEKMIEADIAWFDGHLGNLVLIKEDGKLVAKVLDSDFMWKMDGKTSFQQGPVGSSKDAASVMEALYEFEHPYLTFRIRSMAKHTKPSNAKAMIWGGTHFYPDARFFNYKQLERWGYINYVRGKGWTDGAMRLEDVKDIFPDITDPRWIDPDLGELLKRRSVDPPSNLPDGGQSFNTLPFPGIMPWVRPVRIAA